MTVSIKSNLDGSAVVQVNGVDRIKINADGGVNFGGPCFSAYLTAQQNIVSGDYTKIQFNAKEWDTDNAYDAVTNFRFQPSVAGYYSVKGFLFFNSTAASEGVVRLNKNGAGYRYLADPQAGAGKINGVFGGSTLVYLNGTTDYLELTGYQNSGANLPIGQGVSASYFQAHLVRGA